MATPMTPGRRREMILARRAAAKDAAKNGGPRNGSTVVSPMVRSQTTSSISPRSLPSSAGVSPRNSSNSSVATRSRSLSSHSPLPTLISTTTTIRKSTPWDLDLIALEKTLSTMDSHDKDFKDSATLFMAARWQEVPGLKDRSQNFHISREQWLDYWDSEDRGTKQMGRLVGAKCWSVLLDRRNIGSVGISDIDNFGKTCQRRWRELAIKGEEILMQFEWFYEQRRAQMRLEVIDAVRKEIEGEYETHIGNLARELAQERLENAGRSQRVTALVSELQDVREEYEAEIAELTEKASVLNGDFCNIVVHSEVVDELYPTAQAELERLRKEFDAYKQETQQSNRENVQRQDAARAQYQSDLDALTREVATSKAREEAQQEREKTLRDENTRQLEEMKSRIAFHVEREEQERQAKETAQEACRLEKERSAAQAIANVQESAEKDKALREEVARQLEEMRSRIAFHAEREEEERRGKTDAEARIEDETKARERLQKEIDTLKREFSDKSTTSMLEQQEQLRVLREQHARELEEERRRYSDLVQREEEQRHGKEVASKRAAKEAKSRRAAQAEIAQLRRDMTDAENRFKADAEVERLKIILEERKRSQMELGAELDRVKVDAETAYLEALRLKTNRFPPRPDEEKETDPGQETQVLRKGEGFGIGMETACIEIESSWVETDRNNPVDVDISFSLFASDKRHLIDVTFDDPNYRDCVVLHENVKQGGGQGEVCTLQLNQIPSEVTYVVASITIDSGAVSFRDVDTCSLVVSNTDGNSGICRFDLGDSDQHDCNAMIMAFLSREETGEAQWSVSAVGETANGGTVEEIHADIRDVLLVV